MDNNKSGKNLANNCKNNEKIRIDVDSARQKGINYYKNMKATMNETAVKKIAQDRVMSFIEKP